MTDNGKHSSLLWQVIIKLFRVPGNPYGWPYFIVSFILLYFTTELQQLHSHISFFSGLGGENLETFGYFSLLFLILPLSYSCSPAIKAFFLARGANLETFGYFSLLSLILPLSYNSSIAIKAFLPRLGYELMNFWLFYFIVSNFATEQQLLHSH